MRNDRPSIRRGNRKKRAMTTGDNGRDRSGAVVLDHPASESSAVVLVERDTRRDEPDYENW